MGLHKNGLTDEEYAEKKREYMRAWRKRHPGYSREKMREHRERMKQQVEYERSLAAQRDPDQPKNEEE